MKKILYIIFYLALTSVLFSQTQVQAIGGFAGLGSIKGNSASVSSFTTSIFVDTKMFFTEDATIRLSFFYARKLEALLPDNSESRYYPYQRGFSAKLILDQPLGEYFFLEEGLGPLVLNDRTFSDTDKWGVGVTFHVAAGIDFRNYKQEGFKLAGGSEIGTTFNSTTPMYFSVHLQTIYFF